MVRVFVPEVKDDIVCDLVTRRLEEAEISLPSLRLVRATAAVSAAVTSAAAAPSIPTREILRTHRPPPGPVEVVLIRNDRLLVALPHRLVVARTSQAGRRRPTAGLARVPPLLHRLDAMATASGQARVSGQRAAVVPGAGRDVRRLDVRLVRVRTAAVEGRERVRTPERGVLGVDLGQHASGGLISEELV